MLKNEDAAAPSANLAANNVTVLAPEEDIHLLAMRKGVRPVPPQSQPRTKKHERSKYSNLGAELEEAVGGMTRELLESMRETELRRHVFETRVKSIKAAVDHEDRRLNSHKKSISRAVHSADRSVRSMQSRWAQFVDRQVELSLKTARQYKERSGSWGDRIVSHRHLLGDDRRESSEARLLQRIHELENLRSAVWFTDLVDSLRDNTERKLLGLSGQPDIPENNQDPVEVAPSSCITILVLIKLHILRGKSLSFERFVSLLLRLVQDQRDFSNFIFNDCVLGILKNLVTTPADVYIQSLAAHGITLSQDAMECLSKSVLIHSPSGNLPQEAGTLEDSCAPIGQTCDTCATDGSPLNIAVPDSTECSVP